MAADPITDDIRRFLIEHVRSISGIRLLLLTHADPSREWTGHELAVELRAAPEWAEQELTLFVSQGLLEDLGGEPTRYRFAPRSDELASAVSRLSDIYPEWQHSIIQILFSGPSKAIQSFADAFRLRKDGRDG